MRFDVAGYHDHLERHAMPRHMQQALLFATEAFQCYLPDWDIISKRFGRKTQQNSDRCAYWSLATPSQCGGHEQEEPA
jgi:hypothetical protein